MTEEQQNDNEKWLNDLEVKVEDKLGDFLFLLKGREIESHFQREWKTWSEVEEELKKRSKRVPTSLIQITSYHRSRYNEIKALFENLPDKSISTLSSRWNSLRENFENFSSRIIHSKSPLGIFFLESYRQDPERGEGAYKYFNQQQIDQSNSQELKGFLDAYTFDRKIDSKLIDRERADTESLAKARNDWEQHSINIGNEFDKLKTDLIGWKDNFIKDHTGWTKNEKDEYHKFVTDKKTELENTKKAYTEHIKLEGPARFWKTRARTYRIRGYGWLGGFVAVTLVIGVVLLALLYDPPDSFLLKLFNDQNGAFNPLALKGIIIVAALLSFAAYLIRVFARLALSSFHLERDAEERRQLTMVYLALIKEAAIPEKERDLVLQALFSRADTGLLRGDSSPTMPSLNTLIKRVT